jgi:linoleoyl-CoA desaturase
MFDLDLGEHLRKSKGMTPELRYDLNATLTKVSKQATKDYVVHPLLSGYGWRRTLAANAIANVVRNLWSHSVIMCGHFPEGVETFELEKIDPDESRGAWYLRQMLGSANIRGSKLMHLMSGNLSHQIEHHIFPDLPSNRYAEISREIQDLFKRYGLKYHSAPLVKQVASAWHKVFRLSLPNGWLAETTWRNSPKQLKRLGRMVLSSRKQALAPAPALKALPAAG